MEIGLEMGALIQERIKFRPASIARQPTEHCELLRVANRLNLLASIGIFDDFRSGKGDCKRINRGREGTLLGSGDSAGGDETRRIEEIGGQIEDGGGKLIGSVGGRSRHLSSPLVILDGSSPVSTNPLFTRFTSTRLYWAGPATKTSLSFSSP